MENERAEFWSGFFGAFTFPFTGGRAPRSVTLTLLIALPIAAFLHMMPAEGTGPHPEAFGMLLVTVAIASFGAVKLDLVNRTIFLGTVSGDDNLPVIGFVEAKRAAQHDVMPANLMLIVPVFASYFLLRNPELTLLFAVGASFLRPLVLFSKMELGGVESPYLSPFRAPLEYLVTMLIEAVPVAFIGWIAIGSDFDPERIYPFSRSAASLLSVGVLVVTWLSMVNSRIRGTYARWILR